MTDDLKMLTQLISNPLALIYWLLAFGISLAIHEAAHAWMADRLGDPTAKLSGRLTLNPLAHIDPLGSLMLFFFHFGWGKPVPVDSYNLRNPRRDSGLISLSGPAANFLLATVLSLILRLSLHTSQLSLLTSVFFTPIITLNIYWGLFNLLPIHPLDGGKVLVGFLPQELALKTEEFLVQYQLIFLMLIILPFFGNSLVGFIIEPLASLIFKILLPGIPMV